MSDLNDSYATVQEYRSVIQKSDDGDDLLIQRHLTAVTRLFERETGQAFGKDATATARIFRAKYSDILELDYEGTCPGIADLEDLAIKVDTDGDGSFADETAWSAADYDLEPLQAALDPEPRPWTTIRAIGSKRFNPGNKVEVTAIWGWPAVPEGVWSWVIEMTGIWRSENPRSTGRLNELDAVVAASPVALSAVKRMKDAYMGRVTF